MMSRGTWTPTGRSPRAPNSTALAADPLPSPPGSEASPPEVVAARAALAQLAAVTRDDAGRYPLRQFPAPTSLPPSPPSAVTGDPAFTPDTRNAYLLVGWVNGIDSLLRAMDRRVPPGSEVYLLSEKSLVWRKATLAVDGLALDGSSIEDGGLDADEAEDEAGVSPRSRSAPAVSVAMQQEGGQAQVTEADEGLVNLRLKHIIGFATDDGALKRLPFARAIAAIVSADVDTEDVDTQITDSEVITSAHLLGSIYQAHASKEYRRTGIRCPPLTVLVEFNDVLTKRLVETQPGLVQPERDPFLDGAAGDSYENLDAAPGVAPAASFAELSVSTAGAVRATTGCIEVLPFHRQYLETSALAISANSHASWVMMRRTCNAAAAASAAAAAALP